MSGSILIVQFSANRDGSAFSGLMLADGLREAGWETHVAFGFDGPMVERFREAGHQVRVVAHKNWLRAGAHHRFVRNVWHEIRASRAYKDLLDEVRPDVVYINTAVSLAAGLATKARRRPCVWHLRELRADQGGELVVPAGLAWLPRLLFRQLATTLVANSRAVAEDVLGRGAAPVIVPNAADERYFAEARHSAEARRALGLPEEGLLLGVPGTLRPMKGHAFFFDAVPRLLEMYPSLTVAVTGGGAPSFVEGLHRQVRDLGIDGAVRFLGSVEDMPGFYRACDVVCIPSKAEPFGRTVIEAMAVGTPLVATAVGGIREIVEDGETGLLVNYGDVRALADALLFLLAAPDRRERLRRQGMEAARARFHERAYKQRLVEVVSAVAGSKVSKLPAHAAVEG